jgi:hypothetical protein
MRQTKSSQRCSVMSNQPVPHTQMYNRQDHQATDLERDLNNITDNDDNSQDVIFLHSGNMRGIKDKNISAAI